MARRSGRRREVTEEQARAKWARDGLAAHVRLCWPCHAAGGHPGLYCEAGFALAQDVTRTRLAAQVAARGRDEAQGRLL